jgi:hypothetical protein
MEPFLRRTKKVAKKSHLNSGRPTGQAENNVPTVPTSYSSGSRDEEDLVNYEPEDPLCFSPAEDDISEPEDPLLTPEHIRAEMLSSTDVLGSDEADDAPMAGQKRPPNFPEGEEQRRKAAKDESAASLRRSGKSVIPCKDDSVANLPRSTSGGSKSADEKDDSAAPPRKGGKSAIPAKRDENVANLPRTTSGESKSAIDKDDSAVTLTLGLAITCFPIFSRSFHLLSL